MNRALAKDALRYISRDYANPDAQNRKMLKRHGEVWPVAVVHAWTVWWEYRDRECMAVLEDMTYCAMCGGGIVQEKETSD